MSIENNNSQQSYLNNRTCVFEIYGISPEDKKYNCHHIVTKSDYKNGVVNPDFGLNCKENLYPIRNELHIILTSIIEAVDNDKETTYLMEKWHKTEANLEKREKRIKIKRKIFGNKPYLMPLFTECRVEGKNFGERISRLDLDKLLDFSNNYTSG